MPRPLAALTALALTAGAAGTAVLAKRAARRRIERSPLWPLPALEEPLSGRGTARRTETALRVTVAERATAADGVVRLRLEGAQLPPWAPGAHIDLVLPSGAVRPYSLCGDPADSGAYTIAVRRADEADGGRGGSREVHEHLHEGTEVEIRGPRNRFPLSPPPGPSSSYLFVAGGIGITPVLPMLYAAEAAGAHWRLLYCGRSRASMPFLADIEELAEGAELGVRGGAAPAAPDGPPGAASRVTVVATDESGRPDLSFLAGLPAATAVHCCGPDGLTDAVAAALPEGGVLRRERFTAAVTEGGAFDVELRRTGRTVRVEAGQSVLDAVRAELPDLVHSCRQGFCGTCRQRVLEGEPDHRDELLTDAERADAMLLCVSRCRGARLVLDL